MRRCFTTILLFLGLFSTFCFAGETASSPGGREAMPPQLTITFMDVGQGDGILIECPQGEAVLVDAGPKKAGPLVVNHLKERGVKKLDLIIATHPDMDHIGGLPAVLDAFPADLFIDPGLGHTTYLYQDLLQLLQKKKITYEPARAFDSYELGKVKLEIFNPTNELDKESNNASVVAKVSFGKIGVLLTGDAEGKAEEAMIKRGHDLRSQVLKGGHHGSRNSTSYIFLEKVRPEAVILSYGAKNAFGHPDPETVRAIKFFRAQIYRTAESGNIYFKTDGENYSLWTEKEWKEYLTLMKRTEPPASLNINQAGLEELTRIPFLSEPKARAIIEYRELVRPFEKTEEIVKLPGIGPFIYEKIRQLISVEGGQISPPTPRPDQTLKNWPGLSPGQFGCSFRTDFRTEDQALKKF